MSCPQSCPILSDSGAEWNAKTRFMWRQVIRKFGLMHKSFSARVTSLEFRVSILKQHKYHASFQALEFWEASDAQSEIEVPVVTLGDENETDYSGAAGTSIEKKDVELSKNKKSSKDTAEDSDDDESDDDDSQEEEMEEEEDPQDSEHEEDNDEEPPSKKKKTITAKKVKKNKMFQAFKPEVTQLPHHSGSFRL